MRLVVGILNPAAALRLLDGNVHRAADLVRVHDDPAVRVSCRASDGLNQRSFGSEEALFVSVQDRHQRNLWNIKTLPQQIDTNQHIKRT